MARLRIIGGILGIISLILPWTFSYLKYPNGIFFSFLWLPAGVGVYVPTYGSVVTSYGLINTFSVIDASLSLAGLILILEGSIVLFASSQHPRIGGLLLLIGFFVVAADYGYDEVKYGLFSFIPIGMIFGLVGGVIGSVAKPIKKEKPSPEVDSIEKLQKLKVLLDSGIISNEEFQAQKEKLLEEMKRT